MELRELRKSKNLTQKECADYLGFPLRTYNRYENDESKRNSLKYRFMIDKLGKYGWIDETHGIYSVEDIKSVCEKVFSEYPIEYCYLFGSYAQHKATESSDIDLLIATPIRGLQFYELVENLRTNLKKKIDLLDIRQLVNNFDLTNEILKGGIKIYG